MINWYVSLLSLTLAHCVHLRSFVSAVLRSAEILRPDWSRHECAWEEHPCLPMWSSFPQLGLWRPSSAQARPCEPCLYVRYDAITIQSANETMSLVLQRVCFDGMDPFVQMVKKIITEAAPVLNIFKREEAKRNRNSTN